MAEKTVGPDHFRGWLWKWTNYVKGYQKRWFVLSNGLLSYYKSQAEVSLACRGTIILAGASIVTEDSCHFTISNGSAHRYHLKASSEVERQRWITALELAKSISTEMLDSVVPLSSEESSDGESPPPSARGGTEGSSVDVTATGGGKSKKFYNGHERMTDTEKYEIRATLTPLEVKLADLETCNNLIGKHGTTLLSALSDLEAAEKQAVSNLGASQSTNTVSATKLKAVNERAMLFRITSSAMISACTEFLSVAKTQSRKWQKMLMHEREQRLRLEETVEALAKQHNSLERALNAGTGPPKSGKVQSGQTVAQKSQDNKSGEASDTRDFTSMSNEELSSDEDEFLDAFEDAYGEEIVSNAVEPQAKSAPQEAEDSASTSSSHGSAPSSLSASPSPKKVNKTRTTANGVERRSRIPFKPNHRLVLWTTMKNCIGKDLSKIPMPVNFNEPLSMLQRLSENLEYVEILHKAATCTDSCEQLAHVIAFSVSTYSTTLFRTGKPFNPLLGETFEYDRSEDLGYKIIAEQVSHHPPIAAMHIESLKKDLHGGWSLWQGFMLTSKFRGKYMSLMPLGTCHLKFNSSGHHYTWNRVTTTIHNIIVGKLWVDQHGESMMVNHVTGDKCKVVYTPYSYFSRDTPRKVTGTITDRDGNERYQVFGTWDSTMKLKKIDTTNPNDQQEMILWRKYPLPPLAEKMYYFSNLAITLNEMEEGVAPTDSRRRPDQRKMEDGEWDEANRIKLILEEKQRYRRKLRESEEAKRKSEGLPPIPYKPRWFVQTQCPLMDEKAYVYNNKYWETKEKREWPTMPDIYDISSAQEPTVVSSHPDLTQVPSTSAGRLTPQFTKESAKSLKNSVVKS